MVVPSLLHRMGNGQSNVKRQMPRSVLVLMMCGLISVVSVIRSGVKVPLLVVQSFSIYSPQQQQKSSPLAVEFVSKLRFHHQPTLLQHEKTISSFRRARQGSNDGDDEDDKETTPEFNPYADPNYPDLEFVNYDDPEYSIDRSLTAAEANIEDETLLEQMREERRVANDEFQYNTYWHTVWNAGLSTYRGEWTVYYSSHFFPQFDDDENEEEEKEEEEKNSNGLPHLIQLSDAPLTVVSRAVIQNSTGTTTDENKVLSIHSYIQHIEALEQGMGDVDLAMAGGADDIEQDVVSQTYWPVQLSQADFRGHQGIMICGNAYTICDTVPLINSLVHVEEGGEDSSFVGPFKEYRVELGICANDEARFRIKLDYNILNENNNNMDASSPPPLHLKTMVVCRESADKWPRSSAMARSLFGTPAGAPGGLYDPPIVGGPNRCDQYCQVDLDGSATALFPVIIDQIDNNENDEDYDQDDRIGWVTSLDWTAGGMRYQVDRKVHSGRHVRGLRTLELSEVQGVDADRYRPRDGGQNMRQ